MKSNTGKLLALTGALIGFSIAIGYSVMKNRELNDEVTRQARSVLKTTGKFVKYYRGAADYIVGDEQGNDFQDTKTAYNQTWDSIIKASSERASQ